MNSVDLIHGRVLILVLSGLLVATFLAVLVGAGHGAGPIAYLMVSGDPKAWLLPQVFGWLGCALEVVAAFKVSKSNWRWFAASGLASLVVSATLFVVMSETLIYFQIFGWFMLPFVVIAAVRSVQVFTRKTKNEPNCIL